MYTQFFSTKGQWIPELLQRILNSIMDPRLHQGILVCVSGSWTALVDPRLHVSYAT